MFFDDTHKYNLKVQFEEVDLAGVVHHPNYLKYLERARCDAMARSGLSFAGVLKEKYAIVIAELHQSFLRPALYEQELVVLTRFVAMLRSNMKVIQVISSRAPTDAELRQAGDNLRLLPDVIHAAQIRCVWTDLGTGKTCSVPEFARVALGIPRQAEITDPVKTDVRLKLS
jgi:acyl-CoA thioester hydrolase